MTDYIITNHINIKQYCYAINNYKILYFVTNKNPRSLLKIMNRIKKQLRKIYGKSYLKLSRRCQIVDTFLKDGKISNQSLIAYNHQIHDYYAQYDQYF